MIQVRIPEPVSTNLLPKNQYCGHLQVSQQQNLPIWFESWKGRKTEQTKNHRFIALVFDNV